ncbi:DUF2089 domain-containing protein [Halanaerobiaceae bacterium Z-7014]|uniref:DUF2089 domain-containing protein n=1 Tax=Halonatronomonas betaini TaxID=2778430 RepID=A0A931AWT6_9FIRM|nr:DUF2089 domain-containing protein [Halonatronomonas betaini]MBF8437536.1 DUF2089 domain-containing protein [Halonatronomonas betaini]
MANKVNKLIGKCPVCQENMEITEIKCNDCDTKIRGRFFLDKFSRLDPDQHHFVEVFIRSRGNIKEVEREMGISYPTVRNKLDEVIEALGYQPEDSPDDNKAKKRKEILDSLENGEIQSQEAVEMLKNI